MGKESEITWEVIMGLSREMMVFVSIRRNIKEVRNTLNKQDLFIVFMWEMKENKNSEKIYRFHDESVG